MPPSQANAFFLFFFQSFNLILLISFKASVCFLLFGTLLFLFDIISTCSEFPFPSFCSIHSDKIFCSTSFFLLTLFLPFLRTKLSLRQFQNISFCAKKNHGKFFSNEMFSNDFHDTQSFWERAKNLEFFSSCLIDAWCLFSRGLFSSEAIQCFSPYTTIHI